jgi:hypothetical protein
MNIVSTCMMMSVIPVATVSILFWWFLLNPDKFWYETSCIGKIISFSFYAYVEYQKRSLEAILTSVLVWIWPYHNSNGITDVIMPMTNVIILFWWLPLISVEFWHGTSCITNVVLIPFCAYVEHSKQSLAAILTFIFNMNVTVSQ